MIDRLWQNRKSWISHPLQLLFNWILKEIYSLEPDILNNNYSFLNFKLRILKSRFYFYTFYKSSFIKRINKYPLSASLLFNDGIFFLMIFNDYILKFYRHKFHISHYEWQKQTVYPRYLLLISNKYFSSLRYHWSSIFLRFW